MTKIRPPEITLVLPTKTMGEKRSKTVGKLTPKEVLLEKRVPLTSPKGGGKIRDRTQVNRA